MFKTLACLLLLAFAANGYAQTDPREIIPTRTRGDYIKTGIFGENFVFSGPEIMFLNYVDWLVERHDGLQIANVDPFIYGISHGTLDEIFAIIGRELTLERQIEVDVIDYGISSATAKELFGQLGPVLNSTDMALLDGTNFADPDPITVMDALNRLAAKVKALNGGVDIP